MALEFLKKLFLANALYGRTTIGHSRYTLNCSFLRDQDHYRDIVEIEYKGKD
jgi:hypothetical protein